MQDSGEAFNTCSASLADALETGIQRSIEPKEVNIRGEPLAELPQNMERLIPQNISIDIESHIEDGDAEINEYHRNEPLSIQRNFLDLLQSARNQFDRNSVFSEPNQQGHHISRNHDMDPNMSNRNEYTIDYSQNIHNHTAPSTSPYLRNIRSWRMNLNNVLSFSTPSTETIRSLITNSGTFRYTPLAPLGTSGDVAYNARLPLDQHHENTDRQISNQPFLTIRMSSNNAGRTRTNWVSSEGGNDSVPTQYRSDLPREDLSINNSVNNSSYNRNQTSTPTTSLDTSLNMLEEDLAEIPHLNRNRNSTYRNPLQEDEENNLISDMFIKALTQFMRYLPFICILFAKFIHDHLLGILDLLILHGIMYQLNKSLRDQIAKCSQKSYGILFRDLGLVAVVVAYRFLWAASSPDPFGLLISPPANRLTLDLTINSDSSRTNEKLAVELGNYLQNNPPKDASAADSTVTITKAISVGLLIYYVAVNDLVLKLITIMFKIFVTLMPAKVIRHKPRARIYVVIEYLSQFYRCLAPIRQWLIFLYESYSGLEVISGVLFSSFYMGVKGFEFVQRGKSVKKALEIFLHNMEYERKPTKDELHSAGSLCPICHDSFSAPVVLECGHIFCDECVSTWFKREQTCPMCRAKVSDDPTWQDGATTFFYQLC